MDATNAEGLRQHKVILPEHEAGVHLGHRLAFRHFVEYLEIGKCFGIVEIRAPDYLCGHTLVECSLRQRLGLTVIAIHRGDDVVINPPAAFRLQEGDILAVVDRIKDAERLQP